MMNKIDNKNYFNYCNRYDLNLTNNSTSSYQNNISSLSTYKMSDSENSKINVIKTFSRKSNEKLTSDVKENISPPIPPPFPLSLLNSNKIPLLKERAKTVRIGKVRWPPPLKENETFQNELQR